MTWSTLVLVVAAIAGTAACTTVAGSATSIPPTPLPSPACRFDGGGGHCRRQELHLWGRQVLWQLPEGTAPEGGWPVALLFQGTGFPADDFWDAPATAMFGGSVEPRLVDALLTAGFAVVTPETRLWRTFWDSNIVPWNLAWSSSPDAGFIDELLLEIDRGRLGALDGGSLFVAGISSGGYMASRLATTRPWRVRALAVQSASYAWCGGAFCLVPTLRKDHPPTLLLHGRHDLVVPLWTMQMYQAALGEAGVEVEVDVGDSGHAWSAAAPELILSWFARHRSVPSTSEGAGVERHEPVELDLRGEVLPASKNAGSRSRLPRRGDTTSPDNVFSHRRPHHHRRRRRLPQPDA